MNEVVSGTTSAARAALLARICGLALEARDAAVLLDGVCAMLAGAFGPGSSARVDPDGGPRAGEIAAAVPAADTGTLIIKGAGDVRGEDTVFVQTVAGLVGSALSRIRFEQDLQASEQRMLDAQRIARMGSYDWNIATDTNEWSDELYRIYGCEPQSFNASYERFLSFIHPDDRDRIKEVHRRAYETGEPYQIEERIVRPDGEIRILTSNGRVVMDERGTPIRMVGVCMDVTDQRMAEAASKRDGERFQALVESAPDAVLVVTSSGAIVQSNRQAEALFGYDEAELAAMTIEDLLAPASRGRHAAHRAEFLAGPHPRPMGTSLDISARRKDGTDVYLDVALGVIRSDDGVLVAAFARDATLRYEAERAKRRLAHVEQRRRQALEINDNVVQGLVTAVTAIEAGRFDLGAEAVERTLRSARGMMNDLMGADHPMQAGELVRETAAEPHLDVPPDEPRIVVSSVEPAADGPRPRRVVIADDSDDLRFLLKMLLSRSEDFDVVAEAADGVSAVEAVRTARPDIILLDLAMPRMDGLEAIPAIRLLSPGTRIVVLSGFDSARMSGAATEAGADAYLEKGASMTDIAASLTQICDRIPVARVS